MKGRAKQSQLLFHPYTPAHDGFISRITLQAMQTIFTQSTGIPLTEESILQQLKPHEVTLISNGKKLIGYFCSTRPQNGRIYWGSLILVPEARGLGYGAEIVRHMEQEARRKGVRVIDGHVQVANQKALSFWLNRGFQIIGQPHAGSVYIRKTLAPFY